MVQNEGFFDIGYFPKTITWKAMGSGRFFFPSLETIESTLYVFSISKTSNEVKYKLYNFEFEVILTVHRR